MVMLKQSLGIDMAKESFTACLCQTYIDQTEVLSEVREFSNNKKGFNQLLRWVKKIAEQSVDLHYVMEATGVYYEPLAYHLNKLKKTVHVVLPNKVAHFSKSLNVKSKTDDIDARVISILGCQRQLFDWTPPAPIFKKLKSFCRLYKSLQHDKTQSQNRLKQLECAFEPLKEALKIHKQSIKTLDKQLKAIEKQMEDLLRSDIEIWSKVEKLLTIKGIGLKTIAIVIGETQGFALIKNQRQLVSYCGYDVVRRESGSSIKGKTRISKKGNSNIRSAMYFPAMVASRFNPEMKKTYERLIKNKPSKKIGLVAIQRKLLVLLYTLWKKDEPYDENYKQKRASEIHIEEVPFSSSTQRVEMNENEKVDGEINPPSTQNELQCNSTSEVLLRQ